MLYCDEIYKSIAKKEISSAALVVDESMYSLFYDANEDIESSFRNDHKVRDIFREPSVSNMLNITRALNIFVFNKNCQRQKAEGVQ
ncbi:hypothetical protein SADUNF_Sadunf17G0075600 [Salix dunnii]|uniref:Uncharacterized protein n=1 Tax=Salix dunnii TaxID=1413687 RepID=A0A835MNB6_9ROSI|nr:hypothetical protein SADUNF_Sadunf17G0075600 [Salix dunnii]